MGFFNYLVERHQQILGLLTEHIQLTAIGRNAIRLNSMRPNESQRKTNTIIPHENAI